MVRKGSGSEVELYWRMGKGAMTDVSRALSTDPYVIATEMVANAWDADSPVCAVFYDPQDDLLSFGDFGHGMTPRGLVNYFQVGDSEKRRQPLSPGGRHMMGRFNFATFSIPSLCTQFELRTVYNGVESVVRQDFSRGIPESDQKIPYETHRAKQTRNQTTLKLTGLRFGEGEGFTLRGLYRRLQWEFQLPPDEMTIFLNDTEVTPKVIPSARKFKVDQPITGGRVIGTYYLLNRGSKDSGIHVYVHGRRNGDPSSLIDYDSLTRSAENRILAILHANPLETAILADRTRFDRTDKRFREFMNVVNGFNRQVSQKARQVSAQRQKTRTFSFIPSALAKVTDHLARVGVPEVTRDTEVTFDEGYKGSDLGRYDSINNKIVINGSNPSAFLPEGTADVPFTARAHHEAVMVGAIVDILAKDRVSKGKGVPTLADFLSQREEIFTKFKKMKPKR